VVAARLFRSDETDAAMATSPVGRDRSWIVAMRRRTEGDAPVGIGPYELIINGIRVEIYGRPSSSPPLLFIHGGLHGSWVWEKMAHRLADDGWYAACLNWYGHHGSVKLPDQTALTRSVLDITTEIGTVAEILSRAPVLIAHGMGALAGLAYATQEPVAALILIAPVVPAEFDGDIVDLAVEPTAMWVASPESAKRIWWDKVSDAESWRYASLLCPESPRAVLEATRWLCAVDTSRVEAPALVFAAGADPLIAAAQVRSLAQAIDATFVLLDGEGHGIPVNPINSQVSRQITEWLSARRLG